MATQTFVLFSPRKIGQDDPFWRRFAYFFKGLVKNHQLAVKCPLEKEKHSMRRMCGLYTYNLQNELNPLIVRWNHQPDNWILLFRSVGWRYFNLPSPQESPFQSLEKHPPGSSKVVCRGEEHPRCVRSTRGVCVNSCSKNHEMFFPYVLSHQPYSEVYIRIIRIPVHVIKGGMAIPNMKSWSTLAHEAEKQDL